MCMGYNARVGKRHHKTNLQGKFPNSLMASLPPSKYLLCRYILIIFSTTTTKIYWQDFQLFLSPSVRGGLLFVKVSIPTSIRISRSSQGRLGTSNQSSPCGQKVINACHDGNLLGQSGWRRSPFNLVGPGIPPFWLVAEVKPGCGRRIWRRIFGWPWSPGKPASDSARVGRAWLRLCSGEELLTQTGNFTGRWIEHTEEFLNQTNVFYGGGRGWTLVEEEITDIVLYELVIRIACFLMSYSLVSLMFVFVHVWNKVFNQSNLFCKGPGVKVSSWELGRRPQPIVKPQILFVFLHWQEKHTVQ